MKVLKKITMLFLVMLIIIYSNTVHAKTIATQIDGDTIYYGLANDKYACTILDIKYMDNIYYITFLEKNLTNINMDSVNLQLVNDVTTLNCDRELTRQYLMETKLTRHQILYPNESQIVILLFKSDSTYSHIQYQDLILDNQVNKLIL